MSELILANKSERQVSVPVDGFPLRYLGEFLTETGILNVSEADAERLLQDEEFVEHLFADAFRMATDCAANSDPSEVAKDYGDILTRLNVAHQVEQDDEFDDLDDEDDEDDSDLYDDLEDEDDSCLDEEEEDDEDC